MLVGKQACGVLVFLVIVAAEVYCHVNKNGTKKCDDETHLFYLDGQLVKVEIHYSIQIEIILQDCQPESDIIPVYNVTEASEVTGCAIEGNISWSIVEKFHQLKSIAATDVTPHGIMQECSQLEYIYLNRPNLTLVSNEWLNNCNNLFFLWLEDISVPDLLTVLNATKNAQDLRLKNIDTKNALYDWPILSAKITRKMSEFMNLTFMSIESCASFDFCAPGHHEKVTFSALTSLKLAGTNTSRVCFSEARMMPNLERLEITNTAITKLEISELISTQTSLTVLFTGSIINEIVFDDDYLNVMLNKNKVINIIDLVAIVPCDCGVSLRLKEAVDIYRLISFSKTDLKCEEDNQPFSNTGLEVFACTKFNCNTVCICRKPLDLNKMYTNVDCRYANLYYLARNLTELEQNIEVGGTNASVILLNGKTEHVALESSEVERLFSVESRSFRLVDNSITCTCDNLNLIKALQIHHEKVRDYHKIICVNDQKPLHKFNVTSTTICDDRRREQMLKEKETQRTTTIIVWSMAAIMVLLLVLAVALQYRRSIQIFMFARGWCSCWLREEELDHDRPYDVFLSFCHEDAELVLEQFLPTLEREYSVCIHLRDWNPGDTILNQITLSVQLSRRTVIVLSKNFVKSLWGLLEFRTALACSLEEKRIRLVVIVLDDVVDSSDLQGEFRIYLLLHTYLKWEDPYFWDKLRYVLPHKPNPRAPTLLQQRVVGLPEIIERSAVLPEAEESADASLELVERPDISSRITDNLDISPSFAEREDAVPFAIDTANMTSELVKTASILSDVADRPKS